MTQDAASQDDRTFVTWLHSGDETVPELNEPTLADIAHKIAPLHGQERIRACQAELDRLNGQGVKIWARLSTAMKELDKPPSEEATTWEIFTLADAYRPRPPLEYVVHKLFPLPSLSAVYGAPGTFKSMLLAEMCACVAAGCPWLEPLPDRDDVTPFLTTQAPVLWCDFDNGRRRTHERIEAIGRARELPADTPLYYVSMPKPWLDMSDVGAWNFLAKQIKKLSARLVAIDNLGMVSGKADENSVEMACIMSGFRRVTEETGAAVILIHHQRKNKNASARTGETLRGHSSIEAALDLALLVERKEHAATVKMRSTKARGADVPTFGALFTFAHKGGTDELVTARFFGTAVEGSADNADIDRAVKKVLADGCQLNKGTLAERIKDRLPGIGLNAIRSRIDYLASTGNLILAPGYRGAKFYSLPTRQE